jgi:hypothetical protein
VNPVPDLLLFDTLNPAAGFVVVGGGLGQSGAQRVRMTAEEYECVIGATKVLKSLQLTT